MKKVKEVKSNASKLHADVFKLLKKCFPYDTIEQEKTIKIDGKNLFLDMYIAKMKVAIETDGKQHDNYNSFFHKSISEFKNQQSNDKLKEFYCKSQGITLIRIKYNDKLSQDFLMDKILDGLKKEEE